MKADVFISGGGVAGLTAAAAFATAGYSVIIADPMPPIVTETDAGADLRTTAFLQPARAFLERAGLWQALAPHATSLNTMSIVDASGKAPVERAFQSSDIGDAPFGWNLPNWLLRREMVARLAKLDNVDFRQGLGFARMLTRSTGVHVWLSDGSKVQVKLVIGADGRNSPVREAAGIRVRTTRYGQSALTFAVTHDEPHNNVSTEVHNSGGPFTLVPLPDCNGKPCSSVVWMHKSPEIARLKALSDADFNAEASARSAGVLGDLTLVSRRMKWPIIAQVADALTAERTALVAEAAHVMPPIGAQGLNMSLSDLACLLDLAQASPDPGAPELLSAFQKKRHKDIKLRVRAIDALNRASIGGHPLIHDMRRLGIKALHDIPAARRTAMTMGLGSHS